MQHERGWLKYCRRVVRSDGHRAECAKRGGSPVEDPRVFPSARWPGYLGADYRPGGLLWVNIIHEDLAQRGFRDGAARLAAATATWHDADPTDEEADAAYLAEQRLGYLGGLGTWNVRHLIRDVAQDTLGVGLTAMAYGNAARCQAPIGTTAHVQQDKLVAFCQEWLPLAELLRLIEPAILIVTSAELLRHMPKAAAGLMVIGISQRYRILNGSPWQPHGSPWREALARDWQTHRGT